MIFADHSRDVIGWTKNAENEFTAKVFQLERAINKLLIRYRLNVEAPELDDKTHENKEQTHELEAKTREFEDETHESQQIESGLEKLEINDEKEPSVEKSSKLQVASRFPKFGKSGWPNGEDTILFKTNKTVKIAGFELYGSAMRGGLFQAKLKVVFFVKIKSL